MSCDTVSSSVAVYPAWSGCSTAEVGLTLVSVAGPVLALAPNTYNVANIYPCWVSVAVQTILFYLSLPSQILHYFWDACDGNCSRWNPLKWQNKGCSICTWERCFRPCCLCMCSLAPASLSPCCCCSSVLARCRWILAVSLMACILGEPVGVTSAARLSSVPWATAKENGWKKLIGAATMQGACH